jgi:hypothetical protein
MITTDSAISPRFWRPSPSAERLVLALQWSRLRDPICTVGLESDESCRSGASPEIQAIFRISICPLLIDGGGVSSFSDPDTRLNGCPVCALRGWSNRSV